MNKIFRCKTHNIVLRIDDKGNRHFDTPPGSWGGLPRCQILLLNPVTEGKFGDCEIVKEK